MNMRWHVALMAATVAILLLGPVAGARAQDEEIPCDAFLRNADGSWKATRATYLNGPNFSVRAGGVFRRGDTYKGYDLAAKLDEVCGNAPPLPPPAGATPAAAPPPAAPPAQQPRVALAQFADANGNLDVGRMSCGHIAEASAEELELLLAWYAGADSGPAKRRMINMPRLRYAARSTAAYCKANRDVALVKVMQLYLK
jgi:hypothetical protein